MTFSFPNGAKIFAVDSATGRVLVQTMSVMADSTALIVAGQSLLEWLEAYYSKLQVRGTWNLEFGGKSS